MKFFSLAALVAVALAATPDLSTLPSCSLACFAQGAAAAGCGINDIVCQCTTGKDVVTKTATPCVTKNCNPSDQALTASAALTICNAVVSSSGTTTSNGTSGSNSTNTTISTPRPTQTSNNAGSNFANAAMFSAGLGLVAALVL